jgi:phosphoribosyl-AMP cyclohydrolase
MENTEKFLDKVKFDDKGLVPAVTQDAGSKQVLMLAYMNRESLKLTLETGLCHYYSRSRQKLWKKGETSGNIQQVRQIFYDCDNDSLLIIIDQRGPACHTGNKSCFFRDLKKD